MTVTSLGDDVISGDTPMVTDGDTRKETLPPAGNIPKSSRTIWNNGIFQNIYYFLLLLLLHNGGSFFII